MAFHPPSPAEGRHSLAGLVLAIGGIYVTQATVSMIAMQSLPTLLREAGVPLELIGMSALFMAPWVLKFLWAPAIERLRLPAGRPDRRSKAIILGGQVALGVLCILSGLLHWHASSQHLDPIGLFVAFIIAATLAASVDVACDGMAVDHLTDGNRHWGNTAQVGGAYVGFLFGTSLFLVLCSRFGPGPALLVEGLLVLAMTVPLACFREYRRDPAEPAHRPSLIYALRRKDVQFGLVAIIVLEAGVRTATVMVGPLLIDRGASLDLIGWMFGGFTIGAGLLGAVLGAVLVKRLGTWNAVFAAYGGQALVLAALALTTTADLRLLAGLIGVKFTLMACGLVASYSALMGLSSPRQAGVDFTLFQCADALVAMAGGMLGGWLAGHWGYGICFAAAASFAAAATVGIALLARRGGGWRDRIDDAIRPEGLNLMGEKP